MSDEGSSILDHLEEEMAKAVEWFWSTQAGQAAKQRESERSTRGRRAAVLGGKQMDGFPSLIEDLLIEQGVPAGAIVHNYQATLPGYFRHEKEWDTAVVQGDKLLAAIEFKSIASSFGNNLNNRTEEAVGSNTDLREAYEAGVFAPSPPPWVGYLMLMADTDRSRSPVSVREPNFDVDVEFKDASYARRAELLCLRMVRKQIVDGAAFLLSERETGLEGRFSEPNPELEFESFARRLVAHVTASMP